MIFLKLVNKSRRKENDEPTLVDPNNDPSLAPLKPSEINTQKLLSRNNKQETMYMKAPSGITQEAYKDLMPIE